MNDLNCVMGKIIAQCWLDKDLYNRLIQDPLKLLKETGAVLDETVEIVVQQAQTCSGIEVEGNTLVIKIQPQPAAIADLLLTPNDTDMTIILCLCLACCT